MKYISFLYLFASSLFMLLFSSSGSGQSFQRSIYSNPNVPSDVVAAEVNHDGKPDLLSPQFDSNAFTVFLNHGDGTFPDGGSAAFLVGGSNPSRMVAADFNGDGNIDTATLSCGSGGPGASTLFGNGDGSFRRSRDYIPSFIQPPDCADAFGLITLAGARLPSFLISARIPQISILRNDGQGLFLQQQNVPSPDGAILSGASAGDYNGDHLQDIAAISADPEGPTEHIVIFYQKPDGSFQPPATIFSFNTHFQPMHTVHFKSDSKDDLLVSFSGGPDKRAGVVALTNLGHGRFRSTVLFADPIYTSAGQKPAAIKSNEKREDISKDKHEDIHGIVAPFSPEPSSGDPVFAFFPAQGDTWGKPVYFDDPAGQGPQAVVSADFNGDGLPDFAGVDNANKLIVFLNTTTPDTCTFPTRAGVRICSPATNSSKNSRSMKIHASASAGALPIVAMTAYIDGKQVAESSINTLDASVQTTAGRHQLLVKASDPNNNIYKRTTEFHVR